MALHGDGARLVQDHDSRVCEQRAAVRWMLRREAAQGPVPDPCWRALTTASGVPFWVCGATGDLAVEPPAQPQDFRGGFFCDEPGGGYTRCCAPSALTQPGLHRSAAHCLEASPLCHCYLVIQGVRGEGLGFEVLGFKGWFQGCLSGFGAALLTLGVRTTLVAAFLDVALVFSALSLGALSTPMNALGTCKLMQTRALCVQCALA